MRNIEENSRKHPAVTQEVSTLSVLPLDTDCYGCLLVSELLGCLQGSGPHAASALSPGSEGNSLLSLCASTGHPQAHLTLPQLQVERAQTQWAVQLHSSVQESGAILVSHPRL